MKQRWVQKSEQKFFLDFSTAGKQKLSSAVALSQPTSITWQKGTAINNFVSTCNKINRCVYRFSWTCYCLNVKQRRPPKLFTWNGRKVEQRFRRTPLKWYVNVLLTRTMTITDGVNLMRQRRIVVKMLNVPLKKVEKRADMVRPWHETLNH